MLALLLIVSIVSCNAFYFTIPTGNVAVYYTFQVLSEIITQPGGINLFNALTTTVSIVDVTSQKDEIGPIYGITSDKQMVEFPKIIVWNQLPEEHVYKVLKTYEKPYQNLPYDKALIYDPVINYIKEISSEYTGEQLRSDNYKSLNEMVQNYLEEFQRNRPELKEGESTGLRILKVFVDIPKLSPEVEKNYQEIAVQKTAKTSEAFRQETELKKKETENKIEEMEAEKKRNVAATLNKQNIEKNEAESKIAKINSESQADQKRILADAESYANFKKSEDNKSLLTKEYLLQLQLESYGCQNIIHYGDLPNFLPQYTSM